MKKSFSEFPRGHLDFVTLKQSRTSHNIHVFFFQCIEQQGRKDRKDMSRAGWWRLAGPEGVFEPIKIFSSCVCQTLRRTNCGGCNCEWVILSSTSLTQFCVTFCYDTIDTIDTIRILSRDTFHWCKRLSHIYTNTCHWSISVKRKLWLFHPNLINGSSHINAWTRRLRDHQYF